MLIIKCFLSTLTVGVGLVAAAVAQDGGLQVIVEDRGERAELDQAFAPAPVDLGAFSIDPALFRIFPEDVRGQLEAYSTEVLALLQSGQDDALEKYLVEKREEMAEAFDKLGVAKGAESLPLSRLAKDPLVGDDDPGAAPAENGVDPKTVDLLLKFPDEYKDYGRYLDSLKLDAWEREYLKGSHDVALQLKSSLADARNDQTKVKELLASYSENLEQLNNLYADQIREKYDEALKAADAGGGRPDDGN